MRLRAIAAVLAVCAASVALVACPGVVAPGGGSFSDVPEGHPFGTAISDLHDRGIVSGFGDGRFGPDGPVLRQQFAKMIVSLLRWEVSEADRSPFVDVGIGGPDTLYPDNFVAVAAARGVVRGTGQGRFSPTRHLTRAQMVSMIVRALDSLAPGPLPRPRYDREPTWTGVDPAHAANVRWAESEGLLDGLPLEDLAPQSEATRGEVAQVLHNLSFDVRYFGARGDDATEDTEAFRAALAAVEAGDTVLVPAGTFRIESTLKLSSGIRLRGDGAVLYMPGPASDQALLSVSHTTGVRISGFTLRSDEGRGPARVHGVSGAEGGVVDLVISDLRTESLRYGIKIGSSGASSNISVDGWVGKGDSQSLYLGNVRGGRFSDLDLDCYSHPEENNHNIYLERGNRNLYFQRVRVSGGSGYSVHLYTGSADPADRGGGISFDGLHLDFPEQGVVVERYDGVTLRDVVGGARRGVAVIKLGSLDGFALDDFELVGLEACVAIKGEPTERIANISLSDGSYSQPRLLLGEESAVGLVVRDVVRVPGPSITTVP